MYYYYPSYPLNIISQSTPTSASLEYEFVFCKVKHNRIAFVLTETGVNHKTTQDSEYGSAFDIVLELEFNVNVTVCPDEVSIVPPSPRRPKGYPNPVEKERET
jgi:hypothetical protein